MNSVTIDNEKYVKATDIARELGYTADYVGQLCRAQKVDAQLVGRSWYVSEDSLRSHKKTRYRSTKTANKKTIVTSLEAKDADVQTGFSVPVTVTKTTQVDYADQHFYSRAQKKTAQSYFSDESELIPTQTKVKTGKLSVSLGDAKSIKIKSRSKEYDFNPTTRPEVKFKGSLAITAVYEKDDVDLETEVTPEAKVKTDDKPVTINTEKKSKTDDIANKIKVRHLRKDKKKESQNLPLEHNADGVLGMQRERISARNPVGGTLKIDVPTAHQAVSASGVYFIVISTVCSVLISVLTLGLQAHVHVEGTTLLTSYTFHFQTLMAAVYAAW